MNIVIFDDETTFRKTLEQMIQPMLQIGDSIVSSSGSVQEVLSYIAHNSGLTMYFIDLVIDGKVVGLKLAEKIKEKNQTAIIVFITNYADKVLYTTSHKILSFNIIIKDSPNFKREIAESMNKAKLMQDEKQSLALDNRYSDIFKVYFKDIYYIETIKNCHKLRIHYRNGIYEYRSSMKEIMDRLDNRFQRCHDSFVVNLDQISSISKTLNVITLDNSMKCPYSRKYKKKLIGRVKESL